VKTTVEISDSLLDEAKAYAASRSIPLRQVLEEGLRTVLKRERPTKFRLRDGSFKGHGLQGDMSWGEIRERIYEGRGE